MMRRSLKRLLPLLGLLGLVGCGIREFPEPWQPLDPGQPRARFPTPRVLSEGKGPLIGPGDLVQLHIRNKSADEGTWRERGNWWIWIGFRTPEETSFHSVEPRTASALVGLREGSVIEFVKADDDPRSHPSHAGTLQRNVLGDTRYYSWRKTVTDSVDIYAPWYYDTTTSNVEIKRVCKAKAQYRTIRLFDDSYILRCTWPIHCGLINSPREGWVDEAKIEGTCSDGRQAVFQHGPVPSRNGKEWTGPVDPGNYFNEWDKAAWRKLPTGVVIVGNHPPKVDSTYEMSATVGVPVEVGVFSTLKDSDGDKVTVRIVDSPRNGTLTEVRPGVWSYTATNDETGVDNFGFKASDGMQESKVGRIVVKIGKRAG